MKHVAVALFHPPSGSSEQERLVDAGRRAALRDLISTLREVGLHPTVLVPTLSQAGDLLGLQDAEILEVAEQTPFHFGRTLKSFIREREADGLLYFGSGSGFLLGCNRLDELRRFAERDEPGAVLNNFYSCDFAAVSQAKSLLTVELPEIDNPLGFALADAGVLCSALARSAETQFDLDTPTDLLILRASGRGGAAVRSFLDRLDFIHPFLDRLLALLADRTAHICLVGRVNPKTWSDIEPQVACRTSGLIEGRGMRARTNTGRPILNQILHQDGAESFFARLAHACNGAVIDTRPLLAEAGNLPPAPDRFASDLFWAEKVVHPLWRTFTEAALGSQIPVLLGGHSAVSSGLYLLAEACWKGRDLDRRLHPKPFGSDKERP